MTDPSPTADPTGRLSRRGTLTITARDGIYAVRFKAPGPYQGRAWCTTDEGDLWEHCHLGASDWHGEGTDLPALLVECEEATRPRYRDADEMRSAIDYRRATRTLGPPLPSYMRWHGWRPGMERWLRTSSHAYEYQGGYLRDLNIEREFNEQQEASRERRKVVVLHAR